MYYIYQDHKGSDYAEPQREPQRQPQMNPEEREPEREEQPRSPAFPLNPPEDIEAEVENDTCKICLTNKIRTVNLPCGHLVFCFQCCREFVSNNVQHNCPICREHITRIQMVYN